MSAPSKAPAVFTRENLIERVRQMVAASGHQLALEPTAEGLAKTITGLSLEHCIAGRHDGRAVTFARGFELIFGERLK